MEVVMLSESNWAGLTELPFYTGVLLTDILLGMNNSLFAMTLIVVVFERAH